MLALLVAQSLYILAAVYVMVKQAREAHALRAQVDACECDALCEQLEAHEEQELAAGWFQCDACGELSAPTLTACSSCNAHRE